MAINPEADARSLAPQQSPYLLATFWSWPKTIPIMLSCRHSSGVAVDRPCSATRPLTVDHFAAIELSTLNHFSISNWKTSIYLGIRGETSPEHRTHSCAATRARTAQRTGLHMHWQQVHKDAGYFSGSGSTSAVTALQGG